MKIRKLKFYEFVFIIFTLILVGISAHFILIDRNSFWRLIYPVQARLSIMTIQCSDESPEWMRSLLSEIILEQKNLSNQLAYINDYNQLFACQSGWVGTTGFSKLVTENTRFRYASMTKILTNDAVISLLNQKKLNLNEPFVDRFDEFQNQNFKDERIKKITIGDLLQQRSGFDRLKSEDIMFSTAETPWCPRNLNKLLAIKLDSDPNEYYAYDNRNSCLLGAVIGRISAMSYREYMSQNYKLNQNNIKFINSGYFSDEVKYDFRNNDYWMEADDNSFHFNELSSSAGLTGSASALAQLIKPMLNKHPYNILSISDKSLSSCNINTFKSCNGFAMWVYQRDNSSKKVFFRNGGLPAATSLTAISEAGEVVVWVGNGASLLDKKFDENLLEKKFYQILDK
ncbi:MULTISPECIES: serine hydrolase [unclassified Acinetobacter]|uniref:serine hydrolase domain-containing protein n=1 Tax=unclassified Acinetobacter TaxID=196816 RepID=UPI0015D30BCD|nr:MULTISPECIES: serine hydrolase domain-containing protein [unclassified Acinetobacter]